MRRRLLALTMALVMAISTLTGAAFAQGTPALQNPSDTLGERTLNFNQGWKFVRDYIPEAIAVDYDMEELERWENVDLPHTARLEPYKNSGTATYQGDAMYRKHFPLDASLEGKRIFIEFEAVMGVSDVWVNGVHMTTKLADKTPASGNTIVNAAEGEANTHYGGYMPFVVDITGAVHCDGTDNVIVVHANNRDNSLVPPGKPQSELDYTYFGGIYRNVWMEVTDPVHITDELFEDEVGGGGVLVDVTSAAAVSASVDVKTHVRNESAAPVEATLTTRLLDKDGNVAATADDKSVTLEANTAQHLEQSFSVADPHLWNLDTPYLYTLVSTVKVGGQVVDEVETQVGLRTIEMVRDQGILINGEAAPLLSGVNRHQEYVYIGYAASSALQRRDAIMFKSSGYNVVRAAHYPQSDDFLKACDELGILVIEANPGWQFYPEKDPEVQLFTDRMRDNIRQMVRKDRNHPCVLAYEIVLNESYNVPADYTRKSAEAALAEHPSARIAGESQGYSVAASGMDDYSDIMYGHGDADVLSKTTKAVVMVREYGDHYLEQYGGANLRGRRVSRATGGDYSGGEARMVQNANGRLWEDISVDQGSISLLEKYQRRERSKSFVGATQWIGIDHNRSYSKLISECGDWDLYRLPKYAYYAFESQRPVETDAYLEDLGVSTGPSLFIASEWTATAPVLEKDPLGTTIGTDKARVITVYSNAAKVELSVRDSGGNVLWTRTNEPLADMPGFNNPSDVLDGQTLPKATIPHPPFLFEDVPYTAGSHLLAVAYDGDGTELKRQEVHTAGEPAKLRLELDSRGIDLTADGSDAMMVWVTVEDADGNLCPEASNKIQFGVTGEGSIIGDGDKRVGANPVNTIGGKIGVYIQSTHNAGAITVTASSKGLTADEITLRSVPLTMPAAAYTEIEQGPGFDSGSMNLAGKSPILSGINGTSYDNNVSITVNGMEYPNSIGVQNGTRLEYDLKGGYSEFTAGVGVPSGKGTPVSAIFRVYTDGVLRYVSEPFTAADGPVREIKLDVSGAKTLTLTVTDPENAGLKQACWLSPYVKEGTTPPDESELFVNLTEGKQVSGNIGDASNMDKAVDGDTATKCVGGDVTEGDPDTYQYLVVDLGELTDIRNGKVKLYSDKKAQKYRIYASATNGDWGDPVYESGDGVNGQSSEIVNKFRAGGVRYVKLEFIHVTDGGDVGKNVEFAEFEVYLDKGVDSVSEFDLKGLSVDGKDIAFDPATTEYNVRTNGIEDSLTVKAWAEDPQAVITVNGIKLGKPGAIGDFADAESLTLSAVPDGEVEVAVTAVSGGVKTYVIHVDGSLDISGVTRFSSRDALSMGGNGANHWSYKVKQGDVFTPIDDSKKCILEGHYAWEGDTDWCYAGPYYMHPGGSTDVVRTFTAPRAGDVRVTAEDVKFQGGSNSNGVDISVYQGAAKIWPADKAALTVNTASDLKIDFVTHLEAGDELQFVIDSKGKNGADATRFDAVVDYGDEGYEADSISLSGESRITLTGNGSDQFQYRATALSGETEVLNLPCKWSIKDAPMGVSIDQTGLVTVADTIAVDHFTVYAEAEGKPDVSGEFEVTIAAIGEAGSREVAQGKTATASLQKTGNEAEKALDGNLSTKWYDGDNQNNGNWIKIDLGERCQLSKMEVTWEGGSIAKRYEIQASDTGEDDSFTPIGSHTSSDADLAQANGAAVAQTVPLAGAGRYVRLYVAEHGTWGTSIYEIKIWTLNVKDLEDKIAGAKELVKGDYTDESFAALQTAIGEAEGALATAADRDDVMRAMLALQAAINALSVGEPPAPETHDIVIADSDNGEVTASPASAVKDTEITLTVTPNDGYELETLTVTKTGDTTAVTVTDDKFTMPDCDVTVTATFKKTAAQAAVEAAKSLVEGETYTVAQAAANSEEDITTWLKSAIQNLTGLSGTGVTVGDVTVSEFAAAEADPDGKSGRDGSFTFTVTLTKDQRSATTDSVSGTITKTPYTPPDVTSPPAFVQSTQTFADAEAKTVVFTLSGAAADTYKVYAEAEGGDALEDPAVTVDGDTLILTFTAQPDTQTSYYISAIEGDKAESARTEVTVKPYEAPAPITHSVIFNSNGGSAVAAVTVNDGERAAKPADPARGGYDFAGWYTDEALTVAYDFKSAVTGDLTLYAKWEEQEEPHYIPPSNTTTKTEKNGDGSTTRTVTNKKTGNVVATTTYPDGTKIVAATPKDGETSIEVTMPKSIETVIVTIPTATEPKPGEVAVVVHEDGTKEILKTSIATEDGMRVLLSESCKLEIVDNSRSFTDVASDHWAADAVQFAASRELFTGTGADTFSPAAGMTRGMLMTVLARLDGQDTTAGDTWYSAGMEWAKEQEISDGSAPEAEITRESMAVMLYRYAGNPEIDESRRVKDAAPYGEFADVDSVSGWAGDAMLWAVESGIITGSDNKLNPGGTATRAEVAAMLQRLIGR